MCDLSVIPTLGGLRSENKSNVISSAYEKNRSFREKSMTNSPNLGIFPLSAPCGRV